MPKYAVDVKAFISITVEAENKAAARRIADQIVNDDLHPTDEQIKQISQNLGVTFSTGGFEVDGTSDVDKVDDED